MIAQQFGMAGLLIYSDPADDGFAQGKVFPDGNEKDMRKIRERYEKDRRKELKLKNQI